MIEGCSGCELLDRLGEGCSGGKRPLLLTPTPFAVREASKLGLRPKDEEEDGRREDEGTGDSADET
jgi:hypothetical protein